MATVKQLRYALDTLRGYRQIQDIGQDGQAALVLLNEHVTELERAKLMPDPRHCFRSIPPGTRFQLLAGDESSRDIYLKLKPARRLVLSPMIESYAVNLTTAEVSLVRPEALVKIVEDKKDA